VSLQKAYGPVRAVRGIDLSIAAGETVALLGPNSAGKSTTIDLLLGLARPDKGTVSVLGRPPAEAVRAGAVGGMLQTGSLIEYLSVRELVTMVASLYLHPIGVNEVPLIAGIDEIADRPAAKLSGGQTQRVRFAIALVADPDLLVLDEPTAALDVGGRRDFWNVMRAVAARGKNHPVCNPLPGGGGRRQRGCTILTWPSWTSRCPGSTGWRRPRSSPNRSPGAGRSYSLTSGGPATCAVPWSQLPRASSSKTPLPSS
jgi:ABC-type lipoprotein export system ATPase subunit